MKKALPMCVHPNLPHYTPPHPTLPKLIPHYPYPPKLPNVNISYCNGLIAWMTETSYNIKPK